MGYPLFLFTLQSSKVHQCNSRTISSPNWYHRLFRPHWAAHRFNETTWPGAGFSEFDEDNQQGELLQYDTRHRSQEISIRPTAIGRLQRISYKASVGILVWSSSAIIKLTSYKAPACSPGERGGKVGRFPRGQPKSTPKWGQNAEDFFFSFFFLLGNLENGYLIFKISKIWKFFFMHSKIYFVHYIISGITSLCQSKS